MTEGTNKRKVVAERRYELFKRMLGPESLNEVASDLSEKYDITFETVRNDWYNRDRWLEDLFLIDGESKVFDNLVAEKRAAMQELWDMVEKVKKTDETPDYNNLVQAIKTIDKSTSELIKVFQSVGKIEKEADKLEVESTSEISIAEEIAGIKEAMEDGSEEQN